MRADPPVTLFVSDLHLSAAQTAATARFFDFLDRTATGAAALYILGDLFEAWLGDDDRQSPYPASLVGALRRLADAGTRLYVMHGNRDFLLGSDFARAAGVHLLDDPSRIDLDGTATLLMHGDSLCTDDIDYQHFRAQVHDPAWQQRVLGYSLAERQVMAARLRQQSELSKDGKTAAIMDVNADAVADAFRTHACRRLIHGHTHRPGRHEHTVDGQVCERWVLPDWYVGGGYLRCDASGCRLHELR